MMDGVLVVDKPAGMTSHDVVDAVRKKLSTRKVGHAGTLDPDATGVLLLGVGRATRFLAYSQESPKRYRARARFGISTSTQDASGEVIAERPAEITRDDLEREFSRFVGTIDQIPPMVSAVKVGGERLYKKARRGEEVDRPARSVTIHELNLTAFEAGPPPDATFDVRCSSGTFVRTLIHDLGEALGCGAHMTALRRTATGGFTDAEAIALDDVSPGGLHPLVEAVRELPRLELNASDEIAVSHGRPLPTKADIAEGTPVALMHEGELRAVYKAKDGLLLADRVVST